MQRAAAVRGRDRATPVPRPPLPVTTTSRPSGQHRRGGVIAPRIAESAGQIRGGIIDAETAAAIEKFERERKLPITGQASDRVVRELAAMTGRPLE